MALILNLNLNLGASSPWFSRHPRTCPLNLANTISSSYTNNANTLFILSLSRSTTSFKSKAISNSIEYANALSPSLLSDGILKRVSTVKDADEALEMITEMSPPPQTTNSINYVATSDCCAIVTATLDRNNVQFALSVYSAMCSAFGRGTMIQIPFVDKWKWGRPDVHIYALLVQGLASSLQVSNAIMIINDVCGWGFHLLQRFLSGRL